MSQETQFICDYSDSDNDSVQPSPIAARRSTRIQCHDSPWAHWSSDNITNTLEAAGIPLNHELSREDLVLLAQNTLGNPSTPTPQTPSTSTSSNQPKQAGRKRTAKSSTPPAKRSTPQARAPSPLDTSDRADTNSHLIQSVQSLSQTVKGLASKMANIENTFANPLTSPSPVSNDSAIPQAGLSTVGSNDPSGCSCSSRYSSLQSFHGSPSSVIR